MNQAKKIDEKELPIYKLDENQQIVIDDLIEKDTPIEAPEPQEGENVDKNQEEKKIKKEE